MANTAAHMVDEVLPDVPIRQWVISFPFRIRYLLAYDPKLCCAVRRIFVRSGRRRLFGSHAKVLVSEGQRNRLEHLCRYVARPAIATQRLALSPDGRVIYGLRRHWSDGTSAVSFDPLTFIERLAAQIPRPRAHQHTYHGVLAPAAAYRDLIVPGPRVSRAASPSCTSATSGL